MTPTPQPKPPDWHEQKALPTGERDADGFVPYEVTLQGQVIARGKVQP
jgi:hypothetical protein